MSIKEQHEVRDKYYNEAIRYMSNAKETLKKAEKEDSFYKDIKYVKTACGIAYNGILLALDGYLLLKGIEKQKGRKSIEYYQSNITKIDRKLLYNLNDAYEILHLSGYYDGIRNEKIVKSGFEIAYTIINKIKP
ncbi:MAG: DUF5618 family protein [Bacteroidales bacterium]|jgi:hypothetical protein